MPAVEVIEAAREVTLDEVESALVVAFHRARVALNNGRAVVVLVREEDLLGHGDPPAAAVAGALVGLVRALATEGVRNDWRVNALATTDAVSASDRSEWIDRLSDVHGASGVVVRLGQLHLGRLSV